MSRRQQLRNEAAALRAQVTRQCFHVHSLLAAIDSATEPALAGEFGELAEARIHRAGDLLDKVEQRTIGAAWALVGGGRDGE